MLLVSKKLKRAGKAAPAAAALRAPGSRALPSRRRWAPLPSPGRGPQPSACPARGWPGPCGSSRGSLLSHPRLPRVIGSGTQLCHLPGRPRWTHETAHSPSPRPGPAARSRGRCAWRLSGTPSPELSEQGAAQGKRPGTTAAAAASTSLTGEPERTLGASGCPAVGARPPPGEKSAAGPRSHGLLTAPRCCPGPGGGSGRRAGGVALWQDVFAGTWSGWQPWGWWWCVGGIRTPSPSGRGRPQLA